MSGLLTRGRVIAAVLLIVFAILPPVAEAFDHGYLTVVASRVMIYAIAALSLDLILGYGAMVSFGHAAFIGIGAYCVGIPAYYDNFNGWIQFGYAGFFSALFALVTGAIALRTKGVHFIMITLAFSQMVFFAFVSIEEYGGDDGLVIYSRSEFNPLGDLSDSHTLYYICLAGLLATLYLVHRLVNSRFGQVIRGSRANERRMQAIGFNTYAYRLTCYVIAGVICGLAGALLANFSDFISPDYMNWIRSGDLIFMVILGGSGTLFGPVFGAAAFLLLEEMLSRFWVYWQLIFGALLVLVVLFTRGGIDGLLDLPGRKKDKGNG